MSKSIVNKSILIKKSFFWAQKSQNYWHCPKGTSYSAWNKILQKRSYEALRKKKRLWQALKAFLSSCKRKWKSKRGKDHHQSFRNAQAQNRGKPLAKLCGCFSAS